MKIKEFEALTLKDCLCQVRSDLGPEAVILETRKTRKGGILGLGARDAVRIIAGTGIAVKDEERSPVMRRPASPAGGATDTINPRPSPARQDFPDIAGFLARHAADTTRTAPDDKLRRLEADVSELKQALRSLHSLPAQPAGQRLAELFRRLTEADVREDLVRDLLEAVGEAGDEEADGMLRSAMAARFRVAGPLRPAGDDPHLVAFIGPTGVGKTTTIAKLAAHASLVQKRRVGLITMDTYRIAAVEQLRSYAQIIGLPTEVVHNQAEVEGAVNRQKDCDLILVDTAGRSQKNVMQISELRSFAESVRCETHLVLAAYTRERDLLDQIDRFSGARVDRLLFTKLDETNTFGTLFNVAAATGIPLSYLGTGQKVPEDIEVASTDALVDRILGALGAEG